jgi:AbrB family looped-hinge helix DNA binding protein
MRGTSGSSYHVDMGDRGRLVIPQAVREARGLAPGTRLILLDNEDGILLLTRDQLLARVRADWASSTVSPVDELIAERRAEAQRDNADSAVDA